MKEEVKKKKGEHKLDESLRLSIANCLLGLDGV